MGERGKSGEKDSGFGVKEEIKAEVEMKEVKKRRLPDNQLTL